MNMWINRRWVLVACCYFLLMDICVAQEDETGTEATSPSAPCQTTDGEAGFCNPLTGCPSLSDLDFIANNTCNLDDSGTSGVCCSLEIPPLPQSQSRPAFAFAAPAVISGPPPPPVERRIFDASRTLAVQAIDNRTKLEKTIVDEGLTADANTAEDLHSLITFAQPEALEAEAEGALNQQTTIQLRTQFRAAPFSGGSAFASDSPPPLPIPCPIENDCPASKYRTSDGSCNNLEHKNRGKSHTAFTRMSPAAYADGFSEPRLAKSGQELPNCRLLTTSIVQKQTRNVNNPHLDILYMAFGQFIDHDLSQTPTKKVNVSGVLRPPTCCLSDQTLEPVHPECMPITIPEDDPFFKTFNKKCMEFVRSLSAPDCSSGKREQQNQLTSYLDASQIYGNLERLTTKLRSHDKGTLRVSVLGREFPPHQTPCSTNIDSGICLETGDSRATEQPLLSIFHIIFVREHNRIADRLGRIHPEWDDETLFQETRRIVIAIYQQIIYNEFLPILLGNRRMRNDNLVLLRQGFSNEYDSFTDASILNEFATAAFRFGHSLVQSVVQSISNDGKVRSERLQDLFVKPFNPKLLDNYIRGSVSQPCQRMDQNIPVELTNHLFQGRGKFGLDLAAINCQRGRDHGIGSYTALRDACFLEPVHSFKDLEKFMDSAVARSFSQIYENVEDIDLWIGGISERPVPGALVGPVFACIIGEQFKRLRHGDRFWFERGNTESSFTEDQLRQIRKASLARLFCDNTDINEIQPLVFFPAGRWNPKTSCKNFKAIPRLLFGPWRVESF